MPQEDEGGSQVQEALKIFGMIFIADHQSTKVKQPGKQPLDLPSASITTQRSSILGGHAPVAKKGWLASQVFLRKEPVRDDELEGYKYYLGETQTK